MNTLAAAEKFQVRRFYETLLWVGDARLLIRRAIRYFPLFQLDDFLKWCCGSLFEISGLAVAV